MRSGACAAAPILVAAAFVCSAARASLGEIAEGGGKSDGLYLNWLDRSVAPGKDFFQFANGGWIKSHPIPPDRAYWGVDTLLEEQNQIFIRNLIESLTRESWPAGTPRWLRRVQSCTFGETRFGKIGYIICHDCN